MKETKKSLITELGNAIMERDYLEYSVIPALKQKLEKYKLSKREAEDLEMDI